MCRNQSAAYEGIFKDSRQSGIVIVLYLCPASLPSRPTCPTPSTASQPGRNSPPDQILNGSHGHFGIIIIIASSIPSPFPSPLHCSPSFLLLLPLVFLLNPLALSVLFCLILISERRKGCSHYIKYPFVLPAGSSLRFLRPDPYFFRLHFYRIRSYLFILIFSVCSIWATLKQKNRDRPLAHPTAEVINGLPVLPVTWEVQRTATATQRVREPPGEVCQTFRSLG